VKVTPALSKARRTAATLRGLGVLLPFSNSLIVTSLRLALEASRTRDQFNRALAALACSAESSFGLSIEPKHSLSLKCSVCEQATKSVAVKALSHLSLNSRNSRLG
jgi:cyanate permease